MKTKLSLSIGIFFLALSAFATEPPLIDAHLTSVATAKQIREERGPLTLNFQLAVTNRGNDPVTLRRVEVRTDATSGFELTDGTRSVRRVIAPQATEIIPLTARGIAPAGMHLTEPLHLSVFTTFKAPGGMFVKQFSEIIP